MVGDEPTVAGTYFDPLMAEADVELANNTTVQITRSGMPLIVNDNQLELPVSLTLNILSNHLDLESGVAYLGSVRYLAPVLYIHKLNHVPICIFHQNLRGQSRKCYLCYFAPGGFDKTLAGQVNTVTDERTHFARMTPVRAFSFNYVVMKDGEFVDFDDIASANWFDRF